MHIGFILTKNSSEQGFKTFIDFSKLYVGNENVSIYLLGNGVYCGRKNYSNNDLEEIFENSKVYLYENDLKARGIQTEQIKEDIILFSNYDDMVIDVMENFNQVVSF